MRMAMRHRQEGDMEAAILAIDLLRRVFDPKVALNPSPNPNPNPYPNANATAKPNANRNP